MSLVLEPAAFYDVNVRVLHFFDYALDDRHAELRIRNISPVSERAIQELDFLIQRNCLPSDYV